MMAEQLKIINSKPVLQIDVYALSLSMSNESKTENLPKRRQLRVWSCSDNA